MNTYESLSAPKGPRKWLLWSLVFIFLTTLTTFTILEVRHLNSEEPSVIRVILNSLRPTEEASTMPEQKILLVNVENIQEDGEELVKAIVTQVEEDKSFDLERKARDVDINKTAEQNTNKNFYYEEQTPVVIYSKTEQEAPLAYRQEAPIPYQQGSHEEQPYFDGERGHGDYGDEESYYRPQYDDDDSREYYEGPPGYNAEQDSQEGRSSQNRQYDSYYRQWHYATPSPQTAASSPSSKPTSLSSSVTTSSQGNRKLQTMTAAAAAASATGATRDPYDHYMDDYDYPGPPRRIQQYHRQQMQSYRRPQPSSQAVQQKEEQGSEMNFLSILKTIKTMWDLYQSFISAWNTMAEQRNKQMELAKQKYKQKQEEQQQQQLRINSKKPPKINSKTRPVGPTKNPKNPKQTTTTATVNTSTESNTSSSDEDVQEEATKKNQPLTKAKVEPRKGQKGDKSSTQDVDSLRNKRQADNRKDGTSSTEVAEGRYIKGDPLKGYYDFVITEGSYKFWAVFQVGTALLIIYSTFAAIYYSKVNPLVSDYDYTDYLGGARSLSGGDLDFVDDETTVTAEGGGQHQGLADSRGWLSWLPRTGHSLKFILDAIDKLPVDHDASQSGDGDSDDGRGWETSHDIEAHLNESAEKKTI